MFSVKENTEFQIQSNVCSKKLFNILSSPSTYILEFKLLLHISSLEQKLYSLLTVEEEKPLPIRSPPHLQILEIGIPWSEEQGCSGASISKQRFPDKCLKDRLVPTQYSLPCLC